MQKDKNIKILIVDDEESIRELVGFNIQSIGYSTEYAPDGSEAVKAARLITPSLIILDLMMPGINGLEVCRILKNDTLTASIPILMLTAKGEEEDIIKGLEMGADDYVTKPFSIKVLLARVNALLRRNQQTQGGDREELTFDELTIHSGKREVAVKGEKIELTYTEFQILFTLASHPDWVFTRNQLIDEVRGEDYPVTDRSIDFQIVGLRKKLGASSRFIKTVRGVGYRFIREE